MWLFQVPYSNTRKILLFIKQTHYLPESTIWKGYYFPLVTPKSMFPPGNIIHVRETFQISLVKINTLCLWSCEYEKWNAESANNMDLQLFQVTKDNIICPYNTLSLQIA